MDKWTLGSSILMSGQVMTIDWKRILGLGSCLATQQNKAFKDGDISVKKRDGTSDWSHRSGKLPVTAWALKG